MKNMARKTVGERQIEHKGKLNRADYSTTSFSLLK